MMFPIKILLKTTFKKLSTLLLEWKCLRQLPNPRLSLLLALFHLNFTRINFLRKNRIVLLEETLLKGTLMN